MKFIYANASSFQVLTHGPIPVRIASDTLVVSVRCPSLPIVLKWKYQAGQRDEHRVRVAGNTLQCVLGEMTALERVQQEEIRSCFVSIQILHLNKFQINRNPISTQVQHRRGPNMECSQLHQHLRVRRWPPERAWGRDPGHDVSFSPALLPDVTAVVVPYWGMHSRAF